VNKRRLAVLLISGILLVAVIPLGIVIFNPSADTGSSRRIPIMRIPADVDRNHNKVENVFEEEVQSKVAEENGTQFRLTSLVLRKWFTTLVWRSGVLDSEAFRSRLTPPPAEDGLYSTSLERWQNLNAI